MNSFANKFLHLKSKGVMIQYALDIGAYRGEFTSMLLSVWPTCIVRQFEADERQKEFLSPNCFFVLLGDEEKDVNFFTLTNDKITTGSSIYKENTIHYNKFDTVVLNKKMTTMDSLHTKHNFYGDWKNHGLIKIDTQGSEIDILKGANNFISLKKPRFILLECPISLYNVGAPTFVEYINYLNKIGYVIKDIFDMSYINGKLVQIDALFEREEYENSVLG